MPEPHRVHPLNAATLGLMMGPVLLFGGGWLGNQIAHFFGWW